MTKEGTGPTEKWIDAKDARYPYTYDKGGLSKELGVSGIPRAFLVDATGTIVWEGHPASLNGKLIEQHLEGVMELPLYEWPKEARSAKKAFLDGKFGKAIEEARDLVDDEVEGGSAVLASLEGIVKARVAKVESALKRGDVLAAFKMAELTVKGVKGMPEEERLKDALKAIAKDKQLKGWLKDQRELVELKAEELRSKSDLQGMEKSLEKLLKGNEGSFVGDEIEAYLGEVRKRLHSLK